MAAIQHLPQELLSRIVTAAVNPDNEDDASTTSTLAVASHAKRLSSIKSLSETCHALRAHALPLLWHQANIHISFDKLSDSLQGVESFALPSHPVRHYARVLRLHIDSQHVTLNRILLASLDLRLARAISGMSGLQSACVQMKTAFHFPRTMAAILGRPALNSLTIAARGNLHIPAVNADKLEKLLVHSDVGSCRFDLSAFPCLKELSLSMEDNSSCQSWDELRFPPQLWSTLERITLRGFVLDPLQPLGRLNESLQYASQRHAVALKSVCYHLSRDEQDATYAWQILSQLPLTSLSFTVPVLFDARYARRMIQAFPHLQTLELFAFSRAAAWQWPDPFEAYIQAFAYLDNLERLSLNHNELTTASLPPSVPGSLPAFPSTDIILPVDIGSASSPPSSSEMPSGSLDEGVPSEDVAPTEEPVESGPLGLNFRPVASAEDLERQYEVACALFQAIPTLRQVSFEPGRTEKANPNPFGYKILHNTYKRSGARL